MNAIDKIFTDCPFYGVPKVQDALRREHDIIIGRDHTRRLMRLMGLIAIYPKKSRNTSLPDKYNEIHPYLLGNISASYPDHIWGSDITYIRLEQGWCYLCAIMDWYSRYVMAWELSASLESDFCITALNKALKISIPEIHNSDQGSQYTSRNYTDILKNSNIKISMDSKGRYSDNIFTERLWRSVKYEEVYLKSYADIDNARQNLRNYFDLYNNRRPHQSLKYKTPAEVYYGPKTASQDKKDALRCPTTNLFLSR